MKIFEQYTEKEIIQKILAGELALFEILIRRNNASLYKIGRSYNYDHEDTQDLMQDTFIDAYTNLSKFEQRASFKTWIIKMMLNNCFRKKQKFSFKNELAREINEQSIPLFSCSSSTDINKIVMNRELSLVMVFALREMNGLNVAETSEALNITENNVKVRLNRARSMLRKVIEKTYTAQDIFDFNLVYCDALTNSVMHRLKSISNNTPNDSEPPTKIKSGNN